MHNYISTTAAFLAEALYRSRGSWTRREEYTVESEKVAASDDVSSQFLWLHP